MASPCRSGTSIVSIHAPVRGATDDHFIEANNMVVSIHAPVRGATAWRITARPCPRSFNPRAREGRDAKGLKKPTLLDLFQSTRP